MQRKRLDFDIILLMLPFLNLFKKPAGDSFFGVTFDSGAINLILFKDGYPLCSAREHLTKGVALDGRLIDADSFTQTLNVCIERCLNQQPGESSREIFFGVGGGNCIMAITTARQRRDLHEKITKNALTAVYKEIEQNAINSALEEVYQVTGNDSLDLEGVLNETTSIRLDGTIVFDPIGESGEILETEVFNAYCTPSYIDALEDVAKEVKLTLGGVFPLQYLVSRKLKNKQGHNYDATLINVHADYTDVSVIFGGSLTKNRTMPLGGADLEKDLDFWMDGLELAFGDFSGVKTFSNNVYVCGAGLERTDFWEMLEWREWEEKIPFRTKPVFTKIDASMMDLPQDYRGDLLICGLLNICKELA